MFRIFALMYPIGYMFHFAEEWDHIVPTSIIIGLSFVILLFKKHTELSFLAFILYTTILMGGKFPGLANHANFLLFLNIFILGVYAKSFYQSQKNKRKFELDTKELFYYSKWLLILVYFFAGFHKLNSGFFDTKESCAVDFLFRFAEDYDYYPIVQNNFLNLLMPYFVIALELVAPVMLLLKRTQLMALAALFLMHLYLSTIGFYDFSSAAFSLYPLFLFSSIYSQARDELEREVTLYSFLCLLNGLVCGVFLILLKKSSFYVEMGSGIFFIITSLALVTRISIVLYRKKIPLEDLGKEFKRSNSSRWGIFVCSFLIFFALNPYLGLRTGGTFNMFSNAITERDSNHFLMPKWLKLFDYQEDVIWFDKIDKRYRKVSRKMPREGYGVTKVHLKKIAKKWRRRGYRKVPAVYTYKGKQHITTNILEDEILSEPYTFIERRWFSFRGIQKGTPIKCRW